eukprot:7125849-Prymnesium_polylepis.2
MALNARGGVGHVALLCHTTHTRERYSASDRPTTSSICDRTVPSRLPHRQSTHAAAPRETVPLQTT